MTQKQFEKRAEKIAKGYAKVAAMIDAGKVGRAHDAIDAADDLAAQFAEDIRQHLDDLDQQIP